MTQTTELAALGFLNGAINKQTWGDFIVNVKVYGAKGDGVTDDTAAIQTAINYVISVGAKAVGFPHGTYKVTALTGLTSVLLVGDNAVFSGISDTIIQLGNAVTQLSKLTDVDMTVPPTNGQVLSYNTTSSKWKPATPTSTTVTNVKDYGAKGDGVTDDTAAINAAIAALPNNQSYGSDPGKTGGVLFFPKGFYRVSAALTLSTGIVVRGNGTETSVIMPLPTFTGEAVFVFRQNNTGYSTVDIGVESIEIDMNNVNAHAILAYKAYDCVTFTDINVLNVADAYNAYRFIPDPLNTSDKISQTLLITNCMGIHKLKTATAPIFYLEACQEVNMIGCKAFAVLESQLTPPAYADAPLLNPFHFVDCRGVVMIGCSAAFAGKHCIKIEAVTRLVNGFLISGCTFETSPGGLLQTVGTASFAVQNVSIRQNRIEGTIGGISLDYTTYSMMETGNRPTTISANCQQIHIYSEDFTQITDNGLYTNIFGYGNALNSSFVLYPALDIIAKQNPSIEFKTSVDANAYSVQYDKTSGADTGLHIRKNAADVASFTDANVFLYSNGALNLNVSHPFGANQTGIILTVNNGTAVQKRVEIGAADSGGAGFRMLRVSN